MKDPMEHFKAGWSAAKSPADVANEPPTKVEVALGVLLIIAMLMAYCLL